jgi:phosphohistidine phosphatase
MLLLVHHADAVGADVDPQRPLSPEGQAHAEALAREAAARGVKPAVIWHSGKLRARQTAEPFRRACNPLADFAAVRGLQPTDPPEWARDLVTGEVRDVMLVGHMPHLDKLLRLLDRDRFAAGFPRHGLVALREEAEGWVEVWRIDRLA